MKGAEKHRFPAVRAVEERTTSAGWRHDISLFSDLLLCPPVRRDIPCCSRTDLTADGSGFRSDARTRLRLRLATRASTKGRSREVPSARERATCLSRAAAAKARFILSGWVSRFWSIRDKTGSLPAHPASAPPTGGLGPGLDMEAGRRAPYCSVRLEGGPGAELERSPQGARGERCGQGRRGSREQGGARKREEAEGTVAADEFGPRARVPIR